MYTPVAFSCAHQESQFSKIITCCLDSKIILVNRDYQKPTLPVETETIPLSITKFIPGIKVQYIINRKNQWEIATIIYSKRKRKHKYLWNAANINSENTAIDFSSIHRFGILTQDTNTL